MIYLRQSTASQEVPLGHFVDDADGKTAETGLTIANTDIKVWQTGATSLADKNSGGATHMSGGVYYCTLDATDTSVIGPLVLFVAVSGALAVRLECCVLDEAVFDVMFGTTAPATVSNITAATGVDVTKWAGQNVAAVDTNGYPKVTVKSGTGTGEIQLASGVASANVLQITGQTATASTPVTVPALIASTTNITAGTITTVTNLTNAPTNGDLTAAMKSSVTTAATAATPTAAAVMGDVGGDVIGSVGSVTGDVGGDVVGSVGSVATGGIAAASFAAGAVDAAALAADASTEIVTAILAATIETGLTLKNCLRVLAAAAAGKLSGASTTTIVIRNAAADDKDRITATVDSSGNRSAITLDLT